MSLSRLATYGTLVPGRANADQLDGLKGAWSIGSVNGHLVEEGWGASFGCPGIRLDPDGPAVSVHVFTSDDLPAHWARLDAFEGAGYMRVSAPVTTPDGPIMAQIYELAIDRTDTPHAPQSKRDKTND